MRKFLGLSVVCAVVLGVTVELIRTNYKDWL